MAIRHFNEYYEKIEELYQEVIQNIKEQEILFSKQLITEEEFNNFIDSNRTDIATYANLNYIKYLLDMPNKKPKEIRYDKGYLKKMKKRQKTLALSEFLKAKLRKELQWEKYQCKVKGE